MIVRKHQAHRPADLAAVSEEYGDRDALLYSDAGNLTQYGAYVVTLAPGSRSSNRHWHQEEDEFLYVLSGELTIVEDDGAHTLNPGDAACWPAGEANAHHAINRSSSPASYLIVGTRPSHDVCHYPDDGYVLHTEGETWRIVSESGEQLKGGKVDLSTR